MALHLRLLDLRVHEAVVRELARVARGDGAALDALIGECEVALGAAAFRWVNRASRWVIDDWGARLDRARSLVPIEAARALAPIAVSVLAMPGFQLQAPADAAPAPSLVVLGAGDGGLLWLLEVADPWTGTLLRDRFEAGHEEVAEREAMVLFDRHDLGRLASLVEALEVPGSLGRLDFDPATCEETRVRLAALARRALASEATTLAVCVGIPR